MHILFRKSSKWFSERRSRMAFAETFKALSDPVRREILELLKKGPLSAGDIGSHFDMTGATISYHLRILKQADLIFESREKNYIYYQLNTSVLEEILLWISELKGGESDDEGK
jgi:DNA-binding transcriptional ArsR family regulator